jgi:hypothetical protein
LEHTANHQSQGTNVFAEAIERVIVILQNFVRTGARFDGIRLNNHVVVLIYGCMTAQQIEVTRKKYKVNTGKIIEALCVHNWSNVTNWN